jgi:hypothetical protein
MDMRRSNVKRSVRSWGLALILASIVSMAPQVVRAEEQRQATAALREGDDLRDRGQCEEAIDRYRSGMAIMPHWTFILRIADCYRRMGQHDRALPYLRRDLESVRQDWGEENAADVERVISESRGELPARIAVASNIAGATVLVDGNPVGRTPLETNVEPGPHTIEVRQPRYTSRQDQITSRNGETDYLVLDLVRVDPEPNEAEERPDASDRSRPRRLHLLWGGLLLGSGLLLAGGGTTLFLLDGHEFSNERTVSLDTMGPGVLLCVLGLGLTIGGGFLFGLPPMTNDHRQDLEDEDENGSDVRRADRSDHRSADGDPLQ